MVVWTPLETLWHVQHVTTPVRRPRARAYITRHLLVPEAHQADAHECPAGAGGRHGPRGGSEPSRLAPRAHAVRALGLVGLVRPPWRTARSAQGVQ